MKSPSKNKINKCKHGCGNEKAEGRNECYKCRSRGIRERKPIDVCFYDLKSSARKRNLEFSLELAWFKDWVMGTEYMLKKGRLSESLNIDRIRNLEGYTPDNIQILTKHNNVCKYHYEDLKRYIYEGPMPF